MKNSSDFVPPEGKNLFVVYSDQMLTRKDQEWFPELFLGLGPKGRTIYDSTDYWEVNASMRIKFVENLVKKRNKKGRTVVFTNDYWFIRLLEHFCEDEEFCIFCADEEVFVNDFVGIPNNDVLKIGEFIFRCSVRKALKGG
jgi:hypothetical protein